MAKPGTDQASAIDSYLKSKKSPMAGLGKVFVAAGKKYGVDPRLVVSIAGIESSFGKHLFGAHNAWGWGPGRPFSSWEEGITAVTRGLRTGYLDRGLTTPDKIVSRYAPGSDGNDEGNWASTVNQFMGELGAATTPTRRVTAAAGAAPPSLAAPAAPELPPFETSSGIRGAALANMRDLAMGDTSSDPVSMLQGLVAGQRADSLAEAQEAAARAAAQAVTPVPAISLPKGGIKGGVAPPPKSGAYMALPTKWKSTHPTDNLEDEGYTHARDFMGAPGTKVGAPVGGMVIRHGSAQGGESLYLQGDDGRTYWLGHIENALPVGTRVRRGQVIADISPDHAAPHVHLDYTNG